MNIGMVVEAPFPPVLPREKKEAKTLNRAGFQVHLLSAPSPDRESIEKLEDLTIHRASLTKNVVLTKIQRAIHHINNVHPGWYGAMTRFILHNKIQLLHIIDLTFAYTAFAVNKRFKLPLVLDLHENYPAALDQWDPNRGFLRKHITRSQNRMCRIEGKMCHDFDHVLTVVDEMKDRLIKKYRINSDKITVINNAEEKDFGSNIEPLAPNYRARFKKKIILSYIGGFGSHRGLEVVLKGMEIIKKSFPTALFVLVGGPQRYENQLKSLAEKLDVCDVVEFVGWVPDSDLLAFMNASDIGVVPHNSNDHTENTVPHKLFQYMTLGKPVVSSSCRPLQRIVQETDSGLVFDASDPQSFAKEAIMLCKNKELRDQLGKNGRVATVHGDWNWEYQARTLPTLYNRLIEKHSK